MTNPKEKLNEILDSLDGGVNSRGHNVVSGKEEARLALIELMVALLPEPFMVSGRTENYGIGTEAGYNFCRQTMLDNIGKLK